MARRDCDNRAAGASGTWHCGSDKALFGKGDSEPTVLEFLNEQYAAGDITKEEFKAAVDKLDQTPGHDERALDILKKRYAAGELTLTEFENMKTHILT
jgi:uncharacterized membrane protein